LRSECLTKFPRLPLETCRVCPIINLCIWCPAHAYLEKGEMDVQVPYFCAVAHAQAEALGYGATRLHTRASRTKN
jgi:sulfatase maturation enzyme AslB (radical SAM superfamily)